MSGLLSRLPGHSSLLTVLDLGLDRDTAAPELVRRTRILSIVTLALFSVAIPSIFEYWRLGVPRICFALVLTMLGALANLVVLKSTRRPLLCGHVAMLLLASLLTASNVTSGGFYDPNFAWFYVLPAAAAVLVDLRGAAAWLGVTLALTVGFWALPGFGVDLVSAIPEAEHAVQSLFNRVSAIVGLGIIAGSFVAGQRRSERGLTDANEELRKETAYVQLLRHAAVSANEAASLEQAMAEGVARICTTMGWPVGHVYRVRDDGALESTELVHLDDAEHYASLYDATRAMVLPPGIGLAGEALVAGRPCSRHGLGERSTTPRGPMARKLGLHSAFAVPVLVHGDVAAVLEFGARDDHGPDERLLEVLAHIGVQLGRVAERTSLEERVRQSQKMQAVGQLAAGIAHEINNPMSYVRTNLNVLRSEWGALRSDVDKEEDAAYLDARFDDLAELLEESLEGVDRTIAIVSDMQEFSHRGRVQTEAVDLNDVIEGAIRVVAGRAGPGITIERELADIPTIRGSANPLRQVFVNLIVNAIHAVGDHGQIRVVTAAAGREVVARVEDDGRGMTSAVRERLFDPFFTTKSIGEGTGLGLTVSYEIIRSHGGSIRVESEPGDGSTFEIRLPVAAPGSPTEPEPTVSESC